jgi:hypothetical protein
MRDYGKVFSSIWESADFRSLSEDGRALVLYLLTCKHITIAGVCRLPDGYACEDLQWTPERVAEGFRNIEEKGFATRCDDTKWVWVTKFLEWNPPENPNQRKAAAKVANTVPDSCSWKAVFLWDCGPAMGVEPPKKSNPPLTLAEPFRNQKQEQKQEQEQEQDEEETTSPSSAMPPCPHIALIGLFGKHLPELPQPKPELWKGQKARHMRARWVWVLTATKSSNGKRYAENPEQAVDFFDRFFAYVAKSDFLTGRNGKWTNCTLAWLMEEANFAKVIEGSYENREAA